MEHVDVLVVGAGISGIGAGVHLQRHCPDRSYLILEGRERIGGTWDLFRYPGIRSDSDMYTLGFNFKPWTAERAIADGDSILAYLDETVREYGLQPRIRFGHRVESASWDSATARWTVRATHNGEPREFSCSFLYMCSGYYRYDQGYTPDFPGIKDFGGTIIHPQHWPAGFDHAGKRVVVIGSGATAMTLVPELAKTARHVVMLQRSPTYVISRPAIDRFANWLRRTLPAMLAYTLVRWRNVLLQQAVFSFARAYPQRMRNRLLAMARARLRPGYDIATHFTPRYNPWEQRLCLVPDDDLFEAINTNRASVVTGQIEAITATGITLRSGEELQADVIVTATGLNLLFNAGLAVTVDGRPVDFAQTFGYKGMMYSGVPNLATAFGYTNASWTLKADLTSEYVCRLLNHLRKTGTAIATPVPRDPAMPAERWIDFSSGYFERALHLFPKQGPELPWKLHQNYARDIALLRYGAIDDGVMRFERARGEVAAAA